jgi:spore coat protein U-like protein
MAQGKRDRLSAEQRTDMWHLGTSRSMTGPVAALLHYSLFSNAGRTTNWGNTVGTDTLAGTGSGAAQLLTVYGQIPAAQFPRPGSYADTITATITY